MCQAVVMWCAVLWYTARFGRQLSPCAAPSMHCLLLKLAPSKPQTAIAPSIACLPLQRIQHRLPRSPPSSACPRGQMSNAWTRPRAAHTHTHTECPASASDDHHMHARANQHHFREEAQRKPAHAPCQLRLGPRRQRPRRQSPCRQTSRLMPCPRRQLMQRRQLTYCRQLPHRQLMQHRRAQERRAALETWIWTPAAAMAQAPAPNCVGRGMGCSQSPRRQSPRLTSPQTTAATIVPLPLPGCVMPQTTTPCNRKSLGLLPTRSSHSRKCTAACLCEAGRRTAAHC